MPLSELMARLDAKLETLKPLKVSFAMKTISNLKYRMKKNLQFLNVKSF